MDWKDIAGTVGKAAPLLGTLLGGPAGAAVGGLIASALGTTGDAADVAQALASPEAAAKLRQIEVDRQVHLQELAVQAEASRLAAETDALRIAAADRDSARGREVKAADTITPRTLALLVTLGFFGVLGWLLVDGKPAQGGDALLVMLGSLGTAWTAIVSYYFGSSAGSARKDELMAKT